MTKKLEILEKKVIGHALAYTNYLVYIGPEYNKFQAKLIKACNELRDYLNKNNITKR